MLRSGRRRRSHPACCQHDFLWHGQLTSAAGGGSPDSQVGGNGFIRLEGNSVSTTNLNTGGTPYIIATPSAVSVPATGPSIIQATSVAGTPSPQSVHFPGHYLQQRSRSTIVIKAQYVPLNATVSLYIYSEDGADQVVSVPALTGTLASSTTTVSVTYPPQGSWGLIRATWR